MRIAITTPTGNIGRELTKRLLDKGGHELILLARTPDKLTKEQARGAMVYISGNCRSPRRRTMLWPLIFCNSPSSAVTSGSPRFSASAT